MERNKNIDIIRALAILLIVVYHIFAISKVPLIKGPLCSFIEYGGEYGVAVFFMLSGFAIYKSLSRRKDNFSYANFIKDRLKRLLPQYYISLIILLFFTGNGVFLFSNKLNIFSHFFLLHGFFPTIQGAISGVAWALTPIFCFYLISPLLYKAVEKKPKLSLIISIVFSCLFKFLIYNLFSKSINEVGFGTYFTFGKSIFGVIDEFVIGMFLAKYIRNPENNKRIVLNIGLIVISLIGLYFWIYVDKFSIKIITENTQRFSACFEAYIWYSVLSIILAVGIYGFSQIKINYENIIFKNLLVVSKYEYGIYLWHLEFIRNICQVSPYMQELMGMSRRIIYLYLGLGSIFIGFLMSIIIDGVDWKKIYESSRTMIKTYISILIIFIVIIILKNNIILVPQTINNLNIINNSVIDFNKESKIISDYAEKIIPKNKSYAYIDNYEKGYVNFWEIRYLLAPRESKHIVLYIDTVNNGTVTEIYDILSKMDVDYFIIRECKALEELDLIQPDKIRGTVYIRNKKATSIEDLLKKVD